MSYKIGGVEYPSPIEAMLDYMRQQAQAAIQRQIDEVQQDPAANLKKMQDATPVTGGIDLKA